MLAALIGPSSCATVQAGGDVQAAIDSASPGDTVVVGPGKYGPLTIDKPIVLMGSGVPEVQSGVQQPGMTVEADGVKISGFMISGKAEDSASKFNYYMEHRSAKMELDLPNAAVIVEGDAVSIENTTFFSAEVGVYTDGTAGLSIENSTFESCSVGAQLLNTRNSKVESCNFSSCSSYGADIESSENLTFFGNRLLNGKQFGVLLKGSSGSKIDENLASGNTEGIALWDSSRNEITGNRADHNYYGIILAGSDNNTLVDNRAEENSRSEIVSGFGIGISLQDNSTDNILVRNSAKKNYNGIELTRGCQRNAVYGNNITDNTNGVRVDKNYNNLIYHNNFFKNTISAYDNYTHNFWNTTVGNYYSDYRGADANGDGLGDEPYRIPKGSSDAQDSKPLISPCDTSSFDVAAIRADVERYAIYVQEDDQPYQVVGGAIVIKSQARKSPPTFSSSSKLADIL